MPDVAFCRTLRRGMVGDDVIAHKRAISRWNPAVYGWHEFSSLYGEFFENAVTQFQGHRGLPEDGVIGAVTHNQLENIKNLKGEPVFDAYAVKLAADFCREYGTTPEERMRKLIVSRAFFYHSHRLQIAYSQTRPFPTYPPPYVPSRLDCSGLATLCHVTAGAPNPNGNTPSGYGYTGTLMSRGVRVGSVKDLEPGDLIFYGYSSGRPGFNVGDPTHVAVYVGVFDGSHMVVSNGSYPMRFASYRYRSDINCYRHYDVVP